MLVRLWARGGLARAAKLGKNAPKMARDRDGTARRVSRVGGVKCENTKFGLTLAVRGPQQLSSSILPSPCAHCRAAHADQP